MTEAEFVDTLDRFGADLGRWPAPMVAQARTLLDTSQTAKQRLREAVAIAKLLDDALIANELALPRFRSKMLERIARNNPLLSRAAGWVLDGLTGWSRAWRPALVALVPLLLGFTLGAAVPELDAPDDEMVDAVSMYALSETTFEDYQDAQ